MATNRYGLDVDYFKNNLNMIIRDIENYTPDELQRALDRAAKAACVHEYHFLRQTNHRICAVCGQAEPVK